MKIIKIGLYLLIVLAISAGIFFAWLNTCGGYELRLKNMMVLLGEPDKSDISTDGPYIFYEQDSLTLVRVNNEGEIQKTNFPFPYSASFTCFTEEGNDSFRTQLFNYPQVQPDSYPKAEKIFAVSDIEGNFKAFKSILIGGGVINADYQWTFGNGHLVLLGDFFDRGWDVTACLWLIYDLERQAKTHGGYVHFIIGNHEQMNLTGDNRYVDIKYRGLANELGTGFSELYGKDTELGKWLRTKNVAENIGGYLFVHGGISPELIKQKPTLNDINRIAKAQLDPASSTISLLVNKVLTPIWYRGYSRGNTATQSEVEAITSYFHCTAIVVGHTSVNKIHKSYNGSVILIDVPHKKLVGINTPRALFIENNITYVVNEKGQKQEI